MKPRKARARRGRDEPIGSPSPFPSPRRPCSAARRRHGPRERLRRREADWIARRIRDMLDAGEKIVWDEEAAEERPAGGPGGPAGRHRPAVPRLTNVEYYEEALQRYGIDYYLVGGHAFYAQQEIYDLLNLLRTLDSPCDEVSLAGVLRSPMFSLLRRNAVLAFAACGGAGRGAVRRRVARGNRRRSSGSGRSSPRPRSATCGHERPAARGPVDPRGAASGPATTPCCWPSFSASGNWPTCTN